MKNTSILSYTYSRQKRYLILLFFIILCLILFIYLIYYIIKNKKNILNILYNKSNFEDTTPNNEPTTTNVSEETTKLMYGEDGPPKMEENKGCTANSDLVGMCADYENCCGKESNNTCFCAHPFVINCKSEYDKCISNPDNKTKYNTKNKIETFCKEQRKECCMPYNKINIDSSNFKEPIKATQTNNPICLLSSVNNIQQKCMELCQTNPMCASYMVNPLSCKLFSNVNLDMPKIDSSTGKPNPPNPRNDYFIKK